MARIKVGDKIRDIWLRPDYARFDNTLVLGIDWYEVTAQPPEATVARRGRDYKGVMFRMRIKSPVWIDRWR